MFDLDKKAGYWSVSSSFHSSLVKAYFHTIPESFSYGHEKLFGIVERFSYDLEMKAREQNETTNERK